MTLRDEDGFAPVYDDDTVIAVRKGDVQAVLDIATMGDDLGSGFMDSEQVEAMRTLAVAIGLDPMKVTPRSFRCGYRNGVHNPGWVAHWFGENGGAWICDDCHTILDIGPGPAGEEPGKPRWVRRVIPKIADDVVIRTNAIGQALTIDGKDAVHGEIVESDGGHPDDIEDWLDDIENEDL